MEILERCAAAIYPLLAVKKVTPPRQKAEGGREGRGQVLKLFFSFFMFVCV
jgi:hypothetical protein